jgi:hypothetical protein
MSAGFTVGERDTLTGCSCAPCGAEAGTAGAGCAVCGGAARAEERRGLRRIAAAPKRRHETAAIVRTDARRKIPSRNQLHWMLSRSHQVAPVTPGHLPLVPVLMTRAENDPCGNKSLTTGVTLRLSPRLRSGLRQNRAGLGEHRVNLGASGTPPVAPRPLGITLSSLRKLFLFLPLNFPLLPVLISSPTI